jgi:ribosomal protein S21
VLGAGRAGQRDRSASISSVANPKWGLAIQVFVRDNNIDQAMKLLKRKLQREGFFRELRRRRAYEKPSDGERGVPPRLSGARAQTGAEARAAGRSHCDEFGRSLEEPMVGNVRADSHVSQ